VRFLSITAKVISIEDVQTVGKYPDEKLKRDVLLADETGQVALVLWRQRAETIEFKEGDIIDIENAVTS
jgi:ssDNA-binding replication factor A large subunit